MLWWYNSRMPDKDDVKPEIPASARFTYEDFLLFPDDGKRHEIIDGEHFVTPSPNTRHQVIVGNLYWALRGFLEQHPLGRAFLAPFDVVLSNYDVVEPDLLYISRQRLDVLTTKNVRGAPDLVIEIVSEGTRRKDEVIKRRLYERSDVGEYWVVDPELESVKVYQRAEQGLRRAAEYSNEAGDVLTTPRLPGLELPLADVFKD